MERDNNQFWALLEGEYQKALLFCRKLMKNREDGDDLYQDAVIIAHKSFEDLREHDSFRPWLYSVIVNKFKSTIRKPWWKKRAELIEEKFESYRASDPSGSYQAKLQIARALNALSAEDQALITLFELDGWSIRELAELRNTSEGAIKVKLHRARSKMREELEKVQRKSATNQSKKTLKNTGRSQECIATD